MSPMTRRVNAPLARSRHTAPGMRWAYAVLLLLVGCGARTPLGNGAPDASVMDSADTGGSFVDLCAGDGGARQDAETDGGCATCDTCDSGATSLSGVVYDPLGKHALYNVTVYIPTAPLEPFPDGARCAPCGAAVSGKPSAMTTTDVHGHFRLEHVPSGDSVPLVMQLGKWRRLVHVPVKRCGDNIVDDPNVTRLPRTAAEGNLPRIALTTGCDHLECFLAARVGIDASEFTAPGGGGSVDVYVGNGTSIKNPTDRADLLWNDRARLMSYDIVLAACECTVHAQTAEAFANVKYYLDNGGRLFAGHYHYNFFASAAQCGTQRGPCGGPPDFASVAAWSQAHAGPTPTQRIDTSHPRGAALAQSVAAEGLAINGVVELYQLRSDVGEVSSAATRWVYTPTSSGDDTYYLSFNTPVRSATPCGRAVFSDIHSTESAAPNKPKGACGAQVNESVLEFLFFDLSSCVQDDTMPPERPCSR